MKTQKSDVKKINCAVFAITIGIVFYTIALIAIAIILPRGLIYTLCYEILILFINFVLIYSVSSIRNTIKTVEDKLSNDRLMIVHLINFIVYTLMFLVTSTLYTICAL